MSVINGAEKNVLPAEEASFVVIPLSNGRVATLTEATIDRLQGHQELRDGKIVKWSTEVYPAIVGRSVNASQLYNSCIAFYGPEAISRMRCYKWLRGLEAKGFAVINHEKSIGMIVYDIVVRGPEKLETE